MKKPSGKKPGNLPVTNKKRKQPGSSTTPKGGLGGEADFLGYKSGACKCLSTAGLHPATLQSEQVL